MASKDQVIRLSVHEFAVPVPRTGSIDAYSGLSGQQELGIEIHQEIQRERAKELGDIYHPEHPISGAVESGKWRIEIVGRMDGLILDEIPTLEEIKSTPDIKELKRRLNPSHPYILQLRTYGYLHFKSTGQRPALNLVLVSSRTRKCEELEVDLNLPDLEDWIQQRAAEVVRVAKASGKTIKRRKSAADRMTFPFERPRSGQIELISSIEEGFSARQRLVLQAPTGLGKTIGVLHPTLKDSLARGQRTLYITPKNSQHQVAEEAAALLRKSASGLRSLQMSAKSRICMKEEPVCNPALCEFARDHYSKVAEAGVLEKLSKKKSLGFSDFRKMARDFEVCPYELQTEAAATCDLIIADYHYFLAAPSALTHPIGPEVHGLEGLPSLVVDEAHNLPGRAMESLSSVISIGGLERLIQSSDVLPESHALELRKCLLAGIALLRATAAQAHKIPGRIELEAGPFQEIDEELRALLSSYLQEDPEIKKSDPMLKSAFLWGGFTEALTLMIDAGADGPYFALLETSQAQGLVLKIVCSDASAMLSALYENFERVVAFSATIKPFHYFRTLSGLAADNVLEREFKSPFPARNRKILIIPQISTRYTKREQNLLKISEVVRRVSVLQPGNYMVFFPSFEFLERFSREFRPPEGFQVLSQNRGMTRDQTRNILDILFENSTPTIVLAVQGGVFSEGVDYAGEALIGAFIVGPPLPQYGIEQEEKRRFYESRYSEGEAFAYIYPAMAKSIQAAGRVIRTETDRGVIVLMDDRFTSEKFSQSMPEDWFGESARELVSSSILNDVTDFWTKT